MKVWRLHTKLHNALAVGEIINATELKKRLRRAITDRFIKFSIKHTKSDSTPYASGYTEFSGGFRIGVVIHSEDSFTVTNEFIVELTNLLGHEIKHVMQQRSRPRRINFKSDDDTEKYLAIPDELDAFAFEIALDMVLRSHSVAESRHPYLFEYRRIGGKTLTRLLKKICRYEADIFESASNSR